MIKLLCSRWTTRPYTWNIHEYEYLPWYSLLFNPQFYVGFYIQPDQFTLMWFYWCNIQRQRTRMMKFLQCISFSALSPGLPKWCRPRICVGSRIILPMTLLQPTKTDDRKRSNWPPDVNQIVFHWPPRRSIWKFTARVFYAHLTY